MTHWLTPERKPACPCTPLPQQNPCSHSQEFFYDHFQEGWVITQDSRHLEERLYSAPCQFLGVFGQPKAAPLPPMVLLTLPGGPYSPSTHQPCSYRITKVHGEIVVLLREWILKLLAEVSVGDQERQRVHIQTKLGP